MEEMLVSHNNPVQPLKNHIEGVYELNRFYLSEVRQNLQDNDVLHSLVSILSFFHDFGKSTSYFQKYIQSEKESNDKKKNHALLSSILTYFITEHFFKQRGEDNYLLPFFLFVIVRRHHGNLTDFENEYYYFSEDECKRLHLQIESLYLERFMEELSSSISCLPEEVHGLFPLTKEQLHNWVNEFDNRLKKLRRLWNRYMRLTLQNEYNLSNYLLICLLYSLLLDGDKNQAALRKTDVLQKRKDLPNYVVDQYKRMKNWDPTKYMNILREKAYQEINEKALTISGSLFSITLPTGMGKTLASVNFALKLRERRSVERNGVAPRIIYALPFLSVIDQNYQEIEKVLKENGLSLDHTILLKHHSLTDPIYQASEDEVYEDDKGKLLIEGWNSEIIITTYVQLLESIITNRNRALRKFHRFSNSIILLDEVQSLPVKYWPLVQTLFLGITRYLQVDIVLLTATQPKIFTEGEVIPLCEAEKYFKEMNRITLDFQIDKEQTLEEFVDQLDIETDKSYLFIMNTIASARDLYQLLKEKTDEEMVYLSTHVVPAERLERIEEIKSRKYRIVVSTQLIEAGVDIDFDVVYRDFAPLESINQSAGRCNRHGSGTRKGKVVVVRLGKINENGRFYAYGDKIYEKVKLDVTRKVVTNVKTLEEKEFLIYIDKYFELLKSRMDQSESEKFLQGMNTLYFDMDYYPTKKERENLNKLPASIFSLIEDDLDRIDVYVEINDEAEDLWNQYVEIMENVFDPLERYNAFAAIKNKMRDYIVSIPRKVHNQPPFVENMYYVSRAMLNNYYDLEIGYKVESQFSTW